MKRVQRVRHSGVQSAEFVGLEGEITVDQTGLSLRVHDGLRVGGYEQARADAANMQTANTSQDGKMVSAQVAQLDAATAQDTAQDAAIAAIDGRVTANEGNISSNDTDISALQSGKQATVLAAVEDNLASWDAAGQTKDSGLAASAFAPIPINSVIPFIQNFVPTGWEIDISKADRVLRVGASEAAGGTVGGNWVITGLAAGATGGTAISIAQMPPHAHPQTRDDASGAAGGGDVPDANAGNQNWGTTGSAGSGQAHTHPGSTITQNGLWRPSYVDVIPCKRVA